LSAALSQSVSDSRTPALDISHKSPRLPVVLDLLRIRQTTGLSNTALVTAFTKLAFGPGRISFGDFVKLRLFDPAFHDGAPLTEFIGARRLCWMYDRVNYRYEWYGMPSNKVAASTYLSRYGFPVIPLTTIYAPQAPGGDPSLLRGRQDIERFLATPENYPLFGKPAEGFQSLGSIGLSAFRPEQREVETTSGHRIALDQLLNEIETNYRDGYVFQPFIRPHREVAQLCGDRLACARIITALTEAGPSVIRACWKIPAGRNMADNYWRPGNLLAQLDMDSGRVLRVSSGVGLDVCYHEVHPDTGIALAGFTIPQWAEMKQLARQGAALMRHLPIIGWDIAVAETGPIIVEMNHTPDLLLNQFADRRGILDEEFRAFMEFQIRNSAGHGRKKKLALAGLNS
jgi:hypothetical protein